MKNIDALRIEYKKEPDFSKKIDILALIADYSAIQNDWNGYEFTLTHIKGMRKNKKVSDEQRAILYYFEAITWGDISNENFTTMPDDLHIIQKSTSKHEYIEKQLFAYRKALLYENILVKLPQVRSAQLLTNLANLYSKIGRSIEGLELWGRALDFVPNFTMAKGNLAIELKYLSELFYTDIDKYLFLYKAFISFNELEKDIYTTDEAWECFMAVRNRLEANHIKDENDIHWDSPRVRSSKELAYRTWSLKNTLFLNPLNDLEKKLFCASDPLLLPNIVIGVNVGPIFHGMYNELKQQYVSARYILYEGINGDRAHFSDRKVTIANTWDYASSNLNTEKVKLAYRSLFSIFDKVAFFMNEYFHLGYDPSSPKLAENVMKKLPNIGDYEKNYPLSGIVWLLKDIYEESYKNYLDNDTKLIREIRNQIEHKYLKVVDYGLITGRLSKSQFSLTDEIAYYVPRLDFNDKALKLLKLARSLLIYLLLAIKQEQVINSQKMNPNVIIPPIFIDNIEDSWKR